MSDTLGRMRRNPHIYEYIEALKTERELEKSVDRAEARLRKHREKTASWVEMVVEQIAKELCEHTNHKHFEVYGPFGIRAETTIYLMEEDNVSICKQPTWSITLTPVFDFMSDEPDFYLCYDTGRVKDEFPKNSIGYLNNCGNETKELPETIDEIAKLLKYCAAD